MLTRRLCLIAAVILLAATQSWALTTTLSGSLGSFTLVASATQSGSVWTYDYALTFDQANYAAEVFAIANPNAQEFFNATGSGFASPTFYPAFPDADLEWTGGYMTQGNTYYFSYQSYAQPDVVTVATAVYDGGTYADGQTIGMGFVVPEPGSLASLAGMLAGSAFCLRRIRRK